MSCQTITDSHVGGVGTMPFSTMGRLCSLRLGKFFLSLISTLPDTSPKHNLVEDFALCFDMLARSTDALF